MGTYSKHSRAWTIQKNALDQARTTPEQNYWLSELKISFDGMVWASVNTEFDTEDWWWYHHLFQLE